MPAAETKAELAPMRVQPLGLRAQPGLRLTCGRQTETGHPERLDYMRAVEGTLGGPEAFAPKFHEVFGDRPRTCEIAFAANALDQILDIRWKAWGKAAGSTGGVLKALGQTNYATQGSADLPDVLTVWAPDGGILERDITGPQDPLVAELGAKRYTTFRFLIPGVLGLTTWAEVTTTSKVSRDNLWAGVARALGYSGGRIAGLRCNLVLRKARTRYRDDKGWHTSTAWAWGIDTRFTIDEFMDEMQRLTRFAPLPPVRHDDFDRDRELVALEPGPEHGAIAAALSDLPVPADEDARTREEPSSWDRPDDATLNRVAALETRVEDDVRRRLLTGCFGVERADQLRAAEALMYERALALDVDGEQMVLDGEAVEE